jgi:putative acetyltransferase
LPTDNTKAGGNSRNPMLIRAETVDDRDTVYAVNLSAFTTPSEAVLVDALREQAQPIVSLVSEDKGELVGHIMFSSVSLSGHRDCKMMGLAPMAVRPEHQNRGIGSALVEAGLDQCRKLGCIAVVVLGHPEYYPRFGFSPSSRFGIDSEYEVPEEVFMAKELQPGSLAGKTGRVKYHAAFSNV